MIIDAHAHIGESPYARQTADDLLRQMDTTGVDRTIICPMGAHLVVHNRDGNNLIAAAVRAHPDRFIGFATVNPWYGQDALDEIDRGVDQLGLVGLKLHPAMQGFEADDDLVLPIVERAIAHNLPMYIHSGTPVYSLPLQILEIATRYPEGRFILGHMGGADFYVDVPLTFPRAGNVWLETSLTCHAGYVAEAITQVGAERVMFGSDSPTSEIASELTKIRVLGLSEEILPRVLGGNIHDLLQATGGWK